jgi:hypothetical protein
MINDTLLPFDLPAVARKKVTAAFDGGRTRRTAASCCWPKQSDALASPSASRR